jgi:DNA end-binding protein Ku
MRYPYELRASDALELPGDDLAELGVTKAETDLAAQLVATIETDWDPTRYKDTYHDDLLALIKRKAEGETIEVPETPEPTGGEVVDIMDLLKKSVEEARKAKAADKESSGKKAAG